MRFNAVSICLCVLALTPAACNLKSANKPEIATNTPSADLAGRTKKLEELNATLLSRNRVLSLQLEELLAREKRLAAEVNRLRFLSDQQREQLDALSDAPTERDAYRSQCHELAEKVFQLERQLDELKATIASLQAKRQPETRPAVQ